MQPGPQPRRGDLLLALGAPALIQGMLNQAEGAAGHAGCRGFLSGCRLHAHRSSRPCGNIPIPGSTTELSMLKLGTPSPGTVTRRKTRVVWHIWKSFEHQRGVADEKKDCHSFSDRSALTQVHPLSDLWQVTCFLSRFLGSVPTKNRYAQARSFPRNHDSPEWSDLPASSS